MKFAVAAASLMAELAVCAKTRQRWRTRSGKIAAFVLSRMRWSRSASTSEAIKKARAIALRQKMDMFCVCCLIVTSMHAVTYVISFCIGQESDAEFTFAIMIGHWAMLSLMVLPRFMTANAITVLHFLLIVRNVRWLFWEEGLTCAGKYQMDLGRIMFGMLQSDIRITGIANLFVSLSCITWHMLISPLPFYTDAGNVITVELSSCLFMTVSACLFESCIESCFLGQMQLKEILKDQKPLHLLLSSLCDATVELDANFRFRRPCAKLGALLLRPDASVGAAFEDFLAQEERSRFADHVAQLVKAASDSEQPAPAQMIQCKLADSIGNKVPVQLIHSCIVDEDDGSTHLIGVRELSKEVDAVEPAIPLPHLTRESWDARLAAHAAAKRDVVHDEPRESVSEASQASSSQPSSSKGLVSTEQIVVDCRTVELIVVSCSSRFADVCRPNTIIGTPLVDLIPNPAQKQAFARWVQSGVNQMLSNIDHVPSPHGPIHWRTPHGGKLRAHQVRVDAVHFRLGETEANPTESEEATQTEIESEEDDAIPVRLLLERFRLKGDSYLCGTAANIYPENLKERAPAEEGSPAISL